MSGWSRRPSRFRATAAICFISRRLDPSEHPFPGVHHLQPRVSWGNPSQIPIGGRPESVGNSSVFFIYSRHWICGD
jgi:hypothetical protein